MPEKHRKHLQWTPARFVNWAKSIGPSTLKLTQIIIEKKQHPEQAYRLCLGILNLAKSHQPQRLELACQRALAIGTTRYQSIKSILVNKLEHLVVPSPGEAEQNVTHTNIRGAKYYD